MIYLASPYSHPSAEVVFDRLAKTEQALGALLLNREHVYSPIIHFHNVATNYQLPTDAEYWRELNESMIRRMNSVYVLQIEGWIESRGVTMEIEFANSIDLPLFYIHPRTGYQKSISPWIFTKHEEIMKSDRELIEAAQAKWDGTQPLPRTETEQQAMIEEKKALLGNDPRMSLSLDDCKLKAK